MRAIGVFGAAPPVHWIFDVLPQSPPLGWTVNARAEDGISFHRAKDGLFVIVSGYVEEDNRRWLHLSASYQSRVPSWELMHEVKIAFIGPNRAAYMVLPTEAKYINFMPYCLHLWCCLEGEALPDFTHGGDMI